MRSGNIVRLFVAFACFGLPVPETEADLFMRYLPGESDISLAQGQVVGDPQPGFSGPGRLRDNLDIYVAQGRALLTGKSSSGREHSIWFESRTGTFRTLDSSRGGYFEFQPNRYQRLKAARDEMQQKIDKALKNHPEQDHTRLVRSLEEFDNSVLGGAPTDPPEYRASQTKTHIGEYACEEWEVIHQGEKIRELCIAKHSSLEVSDEDWAVLEKMHRTGMVIAGSSGRGAKLIPRFVLDLSAGIPVRMVYFDKQLRGKILSLKSLSTKKLDVKVVTSYSAHRKIQMAPMVRY